MKNKFKVRIRGIEYTLVSSEDEEYVNRVAFMVDKKMAEVYGANPKLSTAMTAVLSAVNLADQVLKEEENSDSLRKQLSDYSEELKKLRAELTECKTALALKESQIESQKESINNFKIDIARKETEISGLKENKKDGGAPRYGSSGNRYGNQ